MQRSVLVLVTFVFAASLLAMVCAPEVPNGTYAQGDVNQPPPADYNTHELKTKFGMITGTLVLGGDPPRCNGVDYDIKGKKYVNSPTIRYISEAPDGADVGTCAPAWCWGLDDISEQLALDPGTVLVGGFTDCQPNAQPTQVQLTRIGP